MKVRLLLTVLSVLSFVTYSRNTGAQEQTSKGFYYPTGSINFRISTRWLASNCDGKGEYITLKGDPKYHVGVDIVPTDKNKVDGSPVYSISDGIVVYRSDKKTSGWGAGNIGLVIKHKISNEQPFFAVYSHIRSNLNEGDLVYAGKSFATIGSLFDEEGRPNHHLHFGINLGHINPSGELVEPRTNLGLMSCKYWPNKNDFENPISWIETQKPPSTAHTLDQQAKQEINTKKITPLRQSSVYTTKNSRTYHKPNCSQLTTKDGLVEFSSPQEAESSGAIPCKNCNQLAVDHKKQSDDKKHGQETSSKPPYQTTESNNGDITPNDTPTKIYSNGEKTPASEVNGNPSSKQHSKMVRTFFMLANEAKYSKAREYLSQDVIKLLESSVALGRGAGIKGYLDDITKHGTIATFDVLKENTRGESGEVFFSITYKDEPEVHYEGRQGLIKEAGIWKIALK